MEFYVTDFHSMSFHFQGLRTYVPTRKVNSTQIEQK